MHLVYLSKFCMTIFCKFSWVLQSPLGKSKTMVMQIFFFLGGGGAVNNMYYGLGENGEFKDFQSDQIQRSSCNIFTTHYACRKANWNLTQVAGTANEFIF